MDDKELLATIEFDMRNIADYCMFQVYTDGTCYVKVADGLNDPREKIIHLNDKKMKTITEETGYIQADKENAREALTYTGGSTVTIEMTGLYHCMDYFEEEPELTIDQHLQRLSYYLVEICPLKFAEKGNRYLLPPYE